MPGRIAGMLKAIGTWHRPKRGGSLHLGVCQAVLGAQLRAILCLGDWRVNISGLLFGDGSLFHFEAVLRALVA